MKSNHDRYHQLTSQKVKTKQMPKPFVSLKMRQNAPKGSRYPSCSEFFSRNNTSVPLHLLTLPETKLSLPAYTSIWHSPLTFSHLIHLWFASPELFPSALLHSGSLPSFNHKPLPGQFLKNLSKLFLFYLYKCASVCIYRYTHICISK